MGRERRGLRVAAMTMVIAAVLMCAGLTRPSGADVSLVVVDEGALDEPDLTESMRKPKPKPKPVSQAAAETRAEVFQHEVRTTMSDVANDCGTAAYPVVCEGDICVIGLEQSSYLSMAMQLVRRPMLGVETSLARLTGDKSLSSCWRSAQRVGYAHPIGEPQDGVQCRAAVGHTVADLDPYLDTLNDLCERLREPARTW